MCLIIKKPSGRRIPRDFLENVHRKNPDGWGCFFARGEQLVWDRGLGFDGLLQLNASLPTDAEVYLHLRQATYGRVTTEMAHPFAVTPGLLLMHNGSLHPLAPDDAANSDTWELARLLRSLLGGLSEAQAASLLRSEGFAKLTAPLLDGSMVVLLDKRGAISLGRPWHTVGREEWEWPVAGIDVSNTYAWTPQCAALLAPTAVAA